MSLPDEIRKLEELRQSGTLSEFEFSDAKAALIRGASATSETQSEKYLADQLAEIKHNNELVKIDKDWEIEREQYLLYGRYGKKLPPSTALATQYFFGSAFGIFWTIMAVSITGNAPNEGPFAIAKIGFPLFGIIFTIGLVAYGIHIHSRAKQYEKALANYKTRRARHRHDSTE